MPSVFGALRGAKIVIPLTTTLLNQNTAAYSISSGVCGYKG